MTAAAPNRRRALAMLIALGAASGARAEDGAPALAGVYACTALCRPSDAPPSITIDAGRVTCTSELGGTFVGRLLGPRTIACFNKTGTLAADGRVLRWSDGVVWTRR